jgi:hypothetical protein
LHHDLLTTTSMTATEKESMHPRRHSSVVGVRVGDLAAAVQPRTTHRRARRWHEQVRVEARRSLEMLAQVDPDAAAVVAGLPELR